MRIFYYFKNISDLFQIVQPTGLMNLVQHQLLKQRTQAQSLVALHQMQSLHIITKLIRSKIPMHWIKEVLQPLGGLDSSENMKNSNVA